MTHIAVTVVLVDEHRTSRVSSAVNGKQPCEVELNTLSATRPAGWKPPAGQVEPRLVRPAWSQERGQPVRGLVWCPVVAPRKPPQAPRSSQSATQPAASEPGPSTPPPAKRSKPAAEPTKGRGKGKAAKAKPAPQPGRWLDRDCNAALNMQRIGESRWRPLELRYWPDQGALPAKGKEYPGLGYKRQELYTKGLYGMMHDAGMLGVLTEEGVTSLKKFRNGALPDPARPGHYIEGPKDSHVANRWDALLPDPRRQKLASPKHNFAQIVHTDGVAISVMFLRPKPAAPPAELPRMGKGLGAVNPLAHLHAEWLGVDPGKTNMATVAHQERSAAGTVVSVRHWKLTAGQYYRDSGIARQAQATKTWLAKVEPQLTALSRVSSKPSSLASYRRFADTVLATYNAMWAETNILKPGGGSANGTSRLPAAQIASQPPETACGLQLQAAASQGIPDWSGSQDRRSMKRHLDQRLYLLVKQQMQGARHPWHFPHSKLQAEETLRAAAERVLVSVMGRQYPVFFIGNAPMAWLPLLPSGGRIFFMLAQVVDDPWGPINLVPDSGALDWAWVTRREATAEYFKDARMAELLGRMLPE
ncbi:hypothetical protein QJQ45_001581 [Haematococcus lacustris]|nr:hypothetical protein QJQ45_001581 [Haematococcus lacustris]